MDMRQLLVMFARAGLALWLGTFLCGGARAQSPTCIADLQERWTELLREADGDIPVETFERVIGLELLVTTHRADGAINRSLDVTRMDGPSLRVDLYSHPGRKFMSASIEWTPGYFPVLTSRSCLDLAKLTKDLADMDWEARPDAGRGQASPFAALFQRGGNLAAYGNALEGKGRRCRLYYRSHYFDPAWTDKVRRAPAKEPEG
jgi:hypothetical protein